MATDKVPASYDGSTLSSASQSFETLTHGGLEMLTPEQFELLKKLVNQPQSPASGPGTVA